MGKILLQVNVEQPQADTIEVEVCQADEVKQNPGMQLELYWAALQTLRDDYAKRTGAQLDTGLVEPALGAPDD